MAIEIEHKYIVINDSYKNDSIRKSYIKQGYISRDPHRIVRIRIIDNKGYITIKGITKGDSRSEFEYEISYSDACEILKLCEGRIIEKTRYVVPFCNYLWEVDEYHGDLSDLTIAEIELKESIRNYPIPSFIGKEVTGDPSFYNSSL